MRPVEERLVTDIVAFLLVVVVGLLVGSALWW
jgi:hypothetical protein